MANLAVLAVGGAKFNAASGGTYTTFTSGGRLYARHTFTAGGTLTVTRSVLPFTVTGVGAGGGGGAPADGFGASGGGVGGFYSAAATLAAIAYAVTVGSGGFGNLPVQLGGGTGSQGGQGGSSSLAGVFTAGGGYGGGGGPSTPNGSPGTGSPSPAADGGYTARDNAAHGLATTVGNGGNPAVGPYPGTNSTAGLSGAVVVEYQIG